MHKGVREILELMGLEGYVADRAVATSVFLARTLRKPLLLEGPAGVGKTEVAKVLARVLDTSLIRLQCYEGLDASTAIYEWNYAAQILQIKLDEQAGVSAPETRRHIFSEEFLLARPLLQALRQDRAPVLLIDEVDRADEEFEAFLLELLSDFQVTIPELGTIQAQHRPYVIVTSNRSRELSDALRRRCLYLWVSYPSFEKELQILRQKVPEAGERLAGQIARFVQALRQLPLDKAPGVAESLDWARALVALHLDALEPEAVSETLGCLLKTGTDLERVSGGELLRLLQVAVPGVSGP